MSDVSQIVTIYTLADPRTGEVRYVGKTINMEARLKSHIAKKANLHRAAWIQSLRKQGVSPVMEILEQSTQDGWQESEKFWIETLRFLGCRLTNLDKGGRDGKSGKRMSDATKLKISRANKISHSTPKFRLENRMRLLGKPRPASVRAKISATRRAVSNKNWIEKTCHEALEFENR